MRHVLPAVCAVMLTALFFSCEKQSLESQAPERDATRAPVEWASEPDANAFYGPPVAMGKGKVRTFIRLTRDRKVIDMGIEMDPGSLDIVPEHHMPGDHSHSLHIDIPFHPFAKKFTSIDHVTINYEPGGHPPPGVYDVEHLDVHFHKLTIDEVNSMTDMSKITIFPSPEYLPAGYVPTIPIPRMGQHWDDIWAPHLPPTNPNRARFTHTMIYGSYNGMVHFIEPMLTLELLHSKQTVHQPFRQPAKVSPTGVYYPKTYGIYYDGRNDRHYITLEDHEMRHQ